MLVVIFQENRSARSLCDWLKLKAVVFVKVQESADRQSHFEIVPLVAGNVRNRNGEPPMVSNTKGPESVALSRPNGTVFDDREVRFLVGGNCHSVEGDSHLVDVLAMVVEDDLTIHVVQTGLLDDQSGFARRMCDVAEKGLPFVGVIGESQLLNCTA